MFPVDAFRRTMIKFVDIVQTLDIPFHITGGAVSSAYGEPRLTQDIDIVISPSRAQAVVEDLITRLKLTDFLFTEAVVRNSVACGDLFQLLDTQESLKLDVYPRELIPGELERSVSVEIFEGLFLPVVSRQDAALSKLIWISKGSARSRRDLRSIFRLSSDADRREILKFATHFGLASLLDEVLREPDEIR